MLCRTIRPGDKQLVTYLVASDPRKPQEEFIEGDPCASATHIAPTHGTCSIRRATGIPLEPEWEVNPKALPAPNVATPSLRAQHVAPRDATEKELAAIWSELRAGGASGV